MNSLEVEIMDSVDAWIREHAHSPDDWVLGGARLTLDQAAELVVLLDLVRPGWRGGALAGHELGRNDDDRGGSN